MKKVGVLITVLMILLLTTNTASANFWFSFGTHVSNYSYYKNDTTLTKIDMEVVTEVGYEAYANCTSLTSANRAWNVKIINDRAFYNCTSLEGIVSTSEGGDPIEKIGNYAFYNCDSFDSLHFNYKTWGPFVGEYEVDYHQTFDHVETLGCYAFCEADGLTNIQLDIVKEISWGAFEKCRNLQKAIFPEATYVNDWAFYQAYKLTDVQIPKAVVVDHCAFREASSLESISLPNVTAIGNGAFQGCTSLRNLTLGDTPPWVGFDAFRDIPMPRNLSIPVDSLYKYDPDGDGMWMGWTLPAPLEDCDILSFSFDGFTHRRVGNIANTRWIWITVPPGTNLKSITPTIEVSPGASVTPASGVPQDYSQCISNNQADLFHYTVRSQSGSKTKHYYVRIQEAASSGKDIVNFTLQTPNVMGSIDENTRTINVWLPCNVGDPQLDFSNLVPLIQCSPGATISPGSGQEESFVFPREYTVTAIDGSKKVYTVNVRYVNTFPTICDGVIGTNYSWLTSKKRIDVTGTLNVPISIDMTGSYTDAENDPLTYYSFGPTLPIGDESIATAYIHFMLLDYSDNHVELQNNTFEYTPTKPGVETFLLFAKDGKPTDKTYTETYVLTITTPLPPSNPPDMIASSAVQDDYIMVNETYTLDLSDIFTDVDNDPLTYLYAEDGGVFIELTGKDFITCSAAAGSKQFVFKANDGTHDSELFTLNLHVSSPVIPNNIPNRKTNIPATNTHSVEVKTEYTIDLSTIFEDANDDELTYSLLGNGTITGKNFTYTPNLAGKTVHVFTAHDGKDESTDTYTVTLTATPKPTPTPVPTTPPTPTPSPVPTQSPEPTPTPNKTPEPTAKPTKTPKSTPTPVPTPIPTPTPSPAAQKTEMPTNTPQSSAAPISTIKPNVIEENKESGTITIEINIEDLPEGTKKIILPGGKTIDVTKTGIITLEINAQDLDENGTLTIIPIDDEGTPLEKYNIETTGKPTTNDAETGWFTISSALLWILIAAVTLAGAIILIYILLKKNSKESNS